MIRATTSWCSATPPATASTCSTSERTRTTASSPPKPEVSLASLIRPTLIFPDLPGRDRKTVLRACAERIAEQGVVPNGETLFYKLEEREELGSTAIGHEVAVPHCKFEGLDRVVVAVGVCQEGVEFDSADGKPVKVLFVVLSPVDAPAEHLKSLAAISRWMKAEGSVDRILAQSDAQAIGKLLRHGGR